MTSPSRFCSSVTFSTHICFFGTIIKKYTSMIKKPDKPISEITSAQKRCESKSRRQQINASGKYELTNNMHRIKRLGICVSFPFSMLSHALVRYRRAASIQTALRLWHNELPMAMPPSAFPESAVHTPYRNRNAPARYGSAQLVLPSTRSLRWQRWFVAIAVPPGRWLPPQTQELSLEFR